MRIGSNDDGYQPIPGDKLRLSWAEAPGSSGKASSLEELHVGLTSPHEQSHGVPWLGAAIMGYNG